MDTNNLMINDWVLHEGEPYQIRQLGIFGENRDGEDYPAVCVGKPKGIGLIIERNEIEPIPLTQKILEKNGFKKELSEDNIHYRFILIYDGVKFSLLYARSVFQWLGPLDFKYVHELQHALRLCGINKEIKV